MYQIMKAYGFKLNKKPIIKNKKTNFVLNEVYNLSDNFYKCY